MQQLSHQIVILSIGASLSGITTVTHEVGKILIATGKRQRNPWKATKTVYPEVGRLR